MNESNTSKGTAYINRQTAYSLLDSVVRQLEKGPPSEDGRQQLANDLREVKRLILASTPY